MRFAIQQIDGRQRAKSKLPTLCTNPDVIFPVHLSVEQCSSEETAQYKHYILERYFETSKHQSLKNSKTRKLEDSVLNTPPSTLIDLTGGFGIDFMTLSPLFNKAIYVEQNEELCRIAQHNLPPTTSIKNTTAEDFLKTLSENSGISEKSPSLLFFLDPARRTESGSRAFAISDCTPDVLALMPLLKRHGDLLFLKLSPMLDWHKAVTDIENCSANVAEVHIVSVKNECKELLLLVELHQDPQPETRLFCKNDNSILEISTPKNPEISKSRTLENSKTRKLENSKTPLSTLNSQHSTLNTPFPTLLLPNASIMKAGCFDFIAEHYNILPADKNSHLFFSEKEIADFPGKQFYILQTFSLNKKDVREALKGITHANISVRNFPLSAEELRKRLKLKDGGNHHIFATTINGEHKLFLTTT